MMTPKEIAELAVKTLDGKKAHDITDMKTERKLKQMTNTNIH